MFETEKQAKEMARRVKVYAKAVAGLTNDQQHWGSPRLLC